MTKHLHCRDLGFDCDAVVTVETDDEIISQVAAHAQSVHDIPGEQLAEPDFVQRVRDQIHDEA